ncbi:MAG: hypothetical protein MRY83_02040 [Flavobacteriales bacterium]|nr:hypothetical protein [Flavobacteriales bacterium]
MKRIILLLLPFAFVMAMGQETELVYKYRDAKPEQSKPPLLILLHGFGSNEKDLFNLALQLDPQYLIICPRAPLSRTTGSYKWYDITINQGQISSYEPSDVKKAEEAIEKFISQLKRKHDFDTNRVIIGGFSQGAILSLNLGMKRPDLFSGIMALSGRLLKETVRQLSSESNPPKTLIVHGTEDYIIPIDQARFTKSIFDEIGESPEYFELKMGHEINKDAIEIINKWLQ